MIRTICPDKVYSKIFGLSASLSSETIRTESLKNTQEGAIPYGSHVMAPFCVIEGFGFEQTGNGVGVYIHA